MALLNLNYETHSLVLEQNSGDSYTRITNTVNGRVYYEMIDPIIFDRNKALSFVENERIVLNNFLRSLVEFHNTDIVPPFPPFIVFKDEYEYYVFCLVNDIPFKEQIWCKTTYIRTDIYTAFNLIKDASVKLLSNLYPDYYHPPKSLFEEWIRQFNENRELYKCDPDEYKEFLEKNEIEAVYHFSSSRNAESIKKYGICSIKYLKELSVNVDYVSTSQSQSIDRYKGFEDYIHLGFEKRHPMLMKALANGVLSSYKIYDINPSVLFLKDTVYSNKNAIKKDVEFSDELDFLLNIPFNLFHKKNFFNLDTTGKDYFQSEILVKHNIPSNLILNL